MKKILLAALPVLAMSGAPAMAQTTTTGVFGMGGLFTGGGIAGSQIGGSTVVGGATTGVLLGRTAESAATTSGTATSGAGGFLNPAGAFGSQTQTTFNSTSAGAGASTGVGGATYGAGTTGGALAGATGQGVLGNIGIARLLSGTPN